MRLGFPFVVVVFLPLKKQQISIASPFLQLYVSLSKRRSGKARWIEVFFFSLFRGVHSYICLLGRIP